MKHLAGCGVGYGQPCDGGCATNIINRVSPTIGDIILANGSVFGPGCDDDWLAALVVDDRGWRQLDFGTFSVMAFRFGGPSKFVELKVEDWLKTWKAKT